MQRKSVKTILFGLLLSTAGSYMNANAAASPANSLDLSSDNSAAPSPIQSGFYASVGYTYAMIENAAITYISLQQLPPDEVTVDYPYLSYSDKYSGASASNAKISYLWSNHWGAEINIAYVKNTSIEGVNGNTNVGNTAVTGQYTYKVNTFYTEALGEYAFALTPRLALLAKAGAGYEYQNQSLTFSGTIVGDGVKFNTVTQQKEQHYGPAAAAELRYAVTSNVSLGVELNDLAASENIVAANANINYRF